MVEEGSTSGHSPKVDVLVPTCGRPAALSVTLATVALQTFPDFRVVVSDQGETPATGSPEVAAVIRFLESKGHEVLVLRNLPRHGMAQQRQFLLDQGIGSYAFYLDDDVILEADLLERLVRVIEEQRCGLVGSALIGLSYRDDVRPHEQGIEFWDGPVEPELLRPEEPNWERHKLHNAANVLHVAERLGVTPECQRPYKVAWVGGCVLFDSYALRASGGFDFHEDLPPAHRGEDIVAQVRVMERFGGCGILPSGAYHQEVPTSLAHRPHDAVEAVLRVRAGGAPLSPGRVSG
ncbi:MAG: glycosyltransferase family 2 protein [Actinomycetota bacterium]|nr:glycosyltransferase family 2 protein [Actinomycetota bacterium]